MLFQRKKRAWPLALHAVVLLVFVAVMMMVWMLPVWLAGYPFLLSALIPEARLLAQTHLLAPEHSRLAAEILWAASALLSWDNILNWTILSAAFMAAALLPWWATVRKLFDVRSAWVSTVILAFFPMYWLIAVRLDGYSFALFFLFLGFASFTHLYPRHRIAAVITTGLCIGAAFAARDALLGLLPWFCIGYFWQERKHWLRAGIEVLLFCAFAYTAFVAPLLPNALQPQMTTIERIQIFLPSLAHKTPGTGHLYPDDYTFEFLRPEFNKIIAERAESSSFLERQQDENYRAIFGVGNVSSTDLIVNGAWLTVNALPEYFFIETVGGALLWLFVIVGAVAMIRKKPDLFVQILGLWISMELLLRFILHFHRSHLMDIGWALALLTALGVVAITDSLHRKKTPAYLLLAGIVLLIVIQMLEANRKQFAELYRRSATLQIYTVTQVLESVPKNAVIAHPGHSNFFTLVDRNRVTVHPDTIEYLAKKGNLADPFRYYDVDYIIGYSEEQAKQILRAMPGIKELTIPEAAELPPLSPFVKYLLHSIR